MRIAVMQASSQMSRNTLIYDSVKEYAKGSEVINLGCFEKGYSYIDVALMLGLLLGSGAADFAVTGCSSGQGMMLAMNSMPGVLCGYAPTPKDAYLFAQINNGNAVSLPLGEEYTWTGEENLRRTVEELFSEPFGGGWPKSEAERKIRDSMRLKRIRSISQRSFGEFINALDDECVSKALANRMVTELILKNAPESEAAAWLRAYR